MNTVKKVKEELNNFFHNINIIYFFLRSQSNLENSISLLKYIKSKNDERIKKNLQKIPIIFIRNGENLNNEKNGPSFFQQLKNTLKKNRIFDLYDDTINQNKKDINNFDDLFCDENLTSDKYSEFIDGI